MENLTQQSLTCLEVKVGRLGKDAFRRTLPHQDWGTMFVVLCDAGEMKVSVNDREITLKGNDMLFVNAFMFMHLIDVSNDFHGYYMEAKAALMFPIVKDIMDVNSQLYFRENPLIHLDDERYAEMADSARSLSSRVSYAQMVGMSASKMRLAHEFMMVEFRAFVLRMLDVCLDHAHPSTKYNDRSDAFVYQFIVEVYNHYREHREVMYYADCMCVSPSYLSTVVKQKTGKPALQWIIDLVVNEAKQELKYGNKSIKEISAELSFSTQSFFGKYFKKYVGISPKEYRERFKGA